MDRPSQSRKSCVHGPRSPVKPQEVEGVSCHHQEQAVLRCIPRAASASPEVMVQKAAEGQEGETRL